MSKHPLFDVSYKICKLNCQSKNKNEKHFTYPYTFFNDSELYSPRFFIGRWSIQDEAEFLALISRTIGYSRLEHPVTGAVLDASYLDNALIVAGNYADTPGVAWPVTPVWTSQWIKDRLIDYNYSNIEEFYFTESNPNEDQTSEIGSAWSYGVGIVNPESEADVAYAIGYGDGGFGQLYPGILKVTGDLASGEVGGFEYISTSLNYSTSGNNLQTTCLMSTITNDSDWGTWPNSFQGFISLGVTVEA